MNIKAFNIRISKEAFQEDQNKINEFLNTVEVKLTSSNFVNTDSFGFWAIVVFYEPKKSSKTNIDTSNLTIEASKIYEALKMWRSAKVQLLVLPHYMICHNSELIAIAIKKSGKLEDFKTIKGFGDNKIVNYGDDIISLLNAI